MYVNFFLYFYFNQKLWLPFYDVVVADAYTYMYGNVNAKYVKESVQGEVMAVEFSIC